MRTELENEKEQFLQQNDQQKKKLETDLANYQMEQAFLRQNLDLSVKARQVSYISQTCITPPIFRNCTCASVNNLAWTDFQISDFWKEKGKTKVPCGF